MIWTGSATEAHYLLGRARRIIEGLVESPTDAIDIRMAQEFLADYRKWLVVKLAGYEVTPAEEMPRDGE